MAEPLLFWKTLVGSRKRGIPLLILTLALALLLFTVIFHTIYPIFEGKEISWLEALLFILETITTVGYGELLPFRSDYTILFTIVLILAGVFMIFMFIPVILEPIFTRIINAPPTTGPSREMKGHVVIAGYGPLAGALIDSLVISDLGIVVVEADEAVARGGLLPPPRRVLVVWGDTGNPHLGGGPGEARPFGGGLRGREDRGGIISGTGARRGGPSSRWSTTLPIIGTGTRGPSTSCRRRTLGKASRGTR